jgi:hypothetical protein
LDEVALVDEGAQDLFEIEGVALSAGEDKVLEVDG